MRLRGRELFASGWYCAESVLLAVAENQAIACDCSQESQPDYAVLFLELPGRVER